MSVSLVIPGKNATRTIRQCLDSVVPMLENGLTEIIFVDDGSTDETESIVAEYPVRIVHAGGLGPGGARNCGWHEAREGLVWFIDSDCVAEPDALKLLVPHLDDPKVAGVGGSYGNMLPGSLLACLIHEEIIERHRQMTSEVDFLGSFNVLYRRSVLQQVGGFDEKFFNGPGSPGAEDAELAYRVHKAGHVLHFESDSLVGHYHPTNLRRYCRAQRHHGKWRVNLYLAHRNQGAGDSYSSLVDHGQPPLAMLILAALPTLAFAQTCWVVPVMILVLLLLQLPMTLRLVVRTGRLKYFAFAPMGMVRAFARGIGMTLGALGALKSRPQPVT